VVLGLLLQPQAVTRADTQLASQVRSGHARMVGQQPGSRGDGITMD
jgi:hypothetical protein